MFFLKNNLLKINRLEDKQAVPLLVCKKEKGLARFFKQREYKSLNSNAKKEKIKFKTIAIVAQIFIFLVLVVGVNFALSEHIEKNSNNDIVFEYKTEEDKKKELLLVNKNYKLDENYEVDIIDFDGIKCDKIVEKELRRLLENANKAGYKLTLVKGYVAFNVQKEEYQAVVNKLICEGHSLVSAELMAEKYCSMPGKSEYQTGLAINITEDDKSSEEFSKTLAYAWLCKNAAEYGFILRNPKEKENKTEQPFDSTRYRYVGRENALKMRSLGMCFEEFCKYKKRR